MLTWQRQTSSLHVLTITVIKARGNDHRAQTDAFLTHGPGAGFPMGSALWDAPLCARP